MPLLMMYLVVVVVVNGARQTSARSFQFKLFSGYISGYVGEPLDTTDSNEEKNSTVGLHFASLLPSSCCRCEDVCGCLFARWREAKKKVGAAWKHSCILRILHVP